MRSRSAPLALFIFAILAISVGSFAREVKIHPKIQVIQSDYKQKLENLGEMKPVLIEVGQGTQGDNTNLSIADISDRDGNIILFRQITAKKYIKGFYTERNIGELGQYSYS